MPSDFGFLMPEQTSINIPNQCRSLFTLLNALADALNHKPLAEGVYQKHCKEGLIVHSGKSGLFLQTDDLDVLNDLHPDKVAHLCRTACHVFMACFSGARQDYLAGRLNKGELISTRLKDGKLSSSKRIARLMGVDSENADTLTSIKQAITLLNKLSFKFSIRKKSFVCSSLVKLSPDALFIKGSEAPNELRGGWYAALQIHPELFDLALKRFTQVPIELIESGDTRAVLHGFTLLCEQSYKRTKEGESLSYDSQRFYRDSGSLQMLRPGDSRELFYLKRSMKLLSELGVVKAYHCVREKGSKVLNFLMGIEQTNKRKRMKPDKKSETASGEFVKLFEKIFSVMTDEQCREAKQALQLEFG